MRYPVVAKTIFSGSLQNTKNSFKIIEADAGLFLSNHISEWIFIGSPINI